MINAPIVFLSFDWKESSGGISRLNIALAKELSALDYEVIIITPDYVQSLDSFINVSQKVVSKRRIIREIQVIIYLWYCKANQKKATFFGSLWYPDGWLLSLSGVKYRLFAHGAEFKLHTQRRIKRGLKLRLINTILGKADFIYANSNYTASVLTQYVEENKIQAIALGVDTERFQPREIESSPDTLVLGTLSRIETFKGHDQVYDALCLLPQEIQRKIVWRIGGVGPYAKAFFEKVQRRSHCFEILRCGRIEEEELNNFYRSLDLFILFTQDNYDSQGVEGFGLVFLEAQASGVPVIGTSTGGIPDAIGDGKGGWLLSQDDLIGLRDLIWKTTLNRDELNEKAKGARKFAEQNDWRSYALKVISRDCT